MEGSTPAYFKYLTLELNVLVQGYLQWLQKTFDIGGLKFMVTAGDEEF